MHASVISAITEIPPSRARGKANSFIEASQLQLHLAMKGEGAHKNLRRSQ